MFVAFVLHSFHVENLGFSRTFKADIRSLIFASIFRISWPTMAIWGQNRVRVGWCDIDLQQTRFLRLGVLASMPYASQCDKN